MVGKMEVWLQDNFQNPHGVRTIEDVMFVSDKDKFIFFHTPKVYGSSIHIFFKDYYGLTGADRAILYHHHHMSAKNINNNPDKKDYFKFAFVRNPMDNWYRRIRILQIRNLNLTTFKIFEIIPRLRIF